MTKWERFGASALLGFVTLATSSTVGVVVFGLLHILLVVVHGLHDVFAVVPSVIVGVLFAGYTIVEMIEAQEEEQVDTKRITRAVDYIVEEVRFSGMSQYEKEMMADYVWDIFDTIGIEKDIKDIYTLILKDRED